MRSAQREEDLLLQWSRGPARGAGRPVVRLPSTLVMVLHKVVPLSFAAILACGASHHFLAPEALSAGAGAGGALPSELAAANPPAETGVFPDEWIRGLDCANDPPIQVHPYNSDLYILRQSKCDTFEAPFLYLIFGEERALLMDTGSFPTSPVARTVDSIVRRWLAENDKDSIELIVAHTHSHVDHVQSDAQFEDVPYVSTIVGLTLDDVKAFWGFQDYPTDVPTIDLGNRVIDVLGTPGHQGASVTLYDRSTHLLMTGDIVYPGHLFVFSAPTWIDFVRSIRRLTQFALTHPVEWVVGCHIEYSDTPGQPYMWSATSHPTEAPLQMSPDVLLDILSASQAMGSNPQCTIFDDFVIHPVYLCGITWNG